MKKDEAKKEVNRGQKIFDFIMERLNEGMNVYCQTALLIIKIQPKHEKMVRLFGDHCRVQRGKSWDSVNYCKIYARWD